MRQQCVSVEVVHYLVNGARHRNDALAVRFGGGRNAYRKRCVNGAFLMVNLPKQVTTTEVGASMVRFSGGRAVPGETGALAAHFLPDREGNQQKPCIKSVR